MALWLCRAGRFGEYETAFIEEKRIYCTFEDVDWDMSLAEKRGEFKAAVAGTYPDSSKNTVANWESQLWTFSRRMTLEDWVLLPSKIKPVVYVGVIQSAYRYDEAAQGLYRHYRRVEWLGEVSRSAFEQDLLFSLGAFMTICQIKRNNAEKRIQAIVRGDRRLIVGDQGTPAEESDGGTLSMDLEDNAMQEIAERIIRKFSGHNMARVVAAILEAKGFTIHVSPPGPDKGVDILASKGTLGFDRPRICVQVKSGPDPIDRTTHDQLLGAMSNHKAEYGLLVSWGGFKRSILKEAASHFFNVRLWSHKEIVQEFLQHYDGLPEEIREAVPLKRIWILDRGSE